MKKFLLILPIIFLFGFSPRPPRVIHPDKNGIIKFDCRDKSTDKCKKTTTNEHHIYYGKNGVPIYLIQNRCYRECSVWDLTSDQVTKEYWISTLTSENDHTGAMK